MKMTLISANVEDYLSSRRVMGFELFGEGYQLRAFARFAKQQGHVGVPTLDLLLKWAHGAIKPGPVTAARRLEVLRPFLKYCRQFDSSAPAIPAGLCGPGHRRIAPHIYTEAEVSALFDAARELKPEGLRSLTYMTLFGLLASTGMRLSEAVHLKEADVNLKQPAVTVRETKFKKSRLVPIHASTAQSLAAYQDATRNVLRGVGVETVFLTAAGQLLPMRTIHSTFDSLRRRWAGSPGAVILIHGFTICATPSSAALCCAASKAVR